MSTYRPGAPPKGPRWGRWDEPRMLRVHSPDYRRSEDERRSHYEFSFRNSSAAPQYPQRFNPFDRYDRVDHYEPARSPPRWRRNDEDIRDQRNLESDWRYDDSRDEYRRHENRRNENGRYDNGQNGNGQNDERRNENGQNENGNNFHPPPPQRPRYQHNNRFRHFTTAARPLLSLKQADTVEQRLGAADDPSAARRFLHVDDMTDSEEEQMDESNSDQDASCRLVSQANETDMAQPNLEPPVKRRALGIVSDEAVAASQVPKWSNPDPYTSLPPADESRKKKDVVKIIRKARIAIERGAGVANQAGANEDFISFGVEETVTPQREAARPSSVTPKDHAEGELRVQSSEPKRSSYLQELYSEHSGKAPGTGEMALSTDIKGSPPGILPKQLPDTDKDAFKTSQRDQDNPLGSRKRTHDDVIKSPPEESVHEFHDSSDLIAAWWPAKDTYSTPWLDRSVGRCENVGFRLHKEICDFYKYVRPQKYEQELREDLLDRLQTMIVQRLDRCKVYCFGSFAAGIYLPNADMDVVVISESFRVSGVKIAGQSRDKLFAFASYLRQSNVAEAGSVQVIPSAKVPLVKFADRITGIRVDMSFENQTGLTTNDTCNVWKYQYPAMPVIVTLIKQFLIMRGYNEVVHGGLGGFSIMCLVTSLMQNMPRIQSGQLTPELHLGEMLIEFLDLYGNRFDVARTGITMNPPGYFNKAQRMGDVYNASKRDRLAITDPNKPDNDISGGTKKILTIFQLFSETHSEIMRAMKHPARRSLLGCMLGGDYTIYKDQRRHLQKIYRQKRGIPEQVAIDLLIQPSPPLYTGENTKQKSKTPEYHAELGPTSNQRTSHYFINPLTEDAQIVAQSLPRTVLPRQRPKVKKDKNSKRPKKERPKKEPPKKKNGVVKKV